MTPISAAISPKDTPAGPTLLACLILQQQTTHLGNITLVVGELSIHEIMYHHSMVPFQRYLSLPFKIIFEVEV